VRRLPVFLWGIATVLGGADLCLKTRDWLTVLAGLSAAFVYGVSCGKLGTANASDVAEPGAPEANKR
jgi:hypothetical protein